MDVAFDLKRKRALGELHAYLRDKVLAMLFFFSSTRTRGSFEAGMAQLGGHAAFIESKTTQISHGDTPKKSARSSGAISTASPSATSIGAWATAT
jgi:ornithine carbamoyltransferase